MKRTVQSQRLKRFFLKLATDGPGAIYMYKIMKKIYKIRLQRDSFRTCSKWPKWQEVSVDIKILSPGIVCPWPVAIYMYLIMKRCVLSQRLKRFFLNLQQMNIVMRPSCWHQNFGPNGLSAPTLGLCLNFFSSITAYFNISSALRWVKQDQWSSSLLRVSVPFYQVLRTCRQTVTKLRMQGYHICTLFMFLN